MLGCALGGVARNNPLPRKELTAPLPHCPRPLPRAGAPAAGDVGPFTAGPAVYQLRPAVRSSRVTNSHVVYSHTKNVNMARENVNARSRPMVPVKVDGQAGWLLPGLLPSGAESRLVVVSPAGVSTLVERRRVTLVG